MKSKNKFLACLLSVTTLFSSCPGFTTHSNASSLSSESKKGIGLGVILGGAGLIFAAAVAGVLISKNHKAKENNATRIVYFKKTPNGDEIKNLKYKYFCASNGSKVLLPFPKDGSSQQNTELINFVRSHKNDLGRMFKELCSGAVVCSNNLFKVETDIPQDILNTAIVDERGEIPAISQYVGAIEDFNSRLIDKLLADADDDEEDEDVSDEEIDRLKAEVDEKPLTNFQLQPCKDCQRPHFSYAPEYQCAARLQSPYKSNLFRLHLNEALVQNRQGVTFNDRFFACRDLPEWRTRFRDVNINNGKIRDKFRESEFLESLKLKTGGSFEEYVFGKTTETAGKPEARIDRIKNGDSSLYRLFYCELLWICEHNCKHNCEHIGEHKDFLNMEDKCGPGTSYKYRLELHVNDLNNECSTEFRSLIESWALVIDGLEGIEKAITTQETTAQELDKSTIGQRILTQIRVGCLEELAQKLAVIAVPEDTTMVRPEIQEVVRYQCADALNVPSHKMNVAHVENLGNEYNMVYKTNLLSSIMTVGTIASYAANYAKAFGEASKTITKCFDDTITYSELCKILDRSARSELKSDKKSFDERFRAVIKNNKSDLEKSELKLIYEWISGRPKKISKICEVMSILTSDADSVPELFFTSEKRFGYITFIKYLVDQGFISLD